MLVNHFLEHAAMCVPDKLALICEHERLTYKQLDFLADRIGRYLIAIGVERHDRVSVLMDNSIETVVSLFGILKAGATFILLNATMKSSKLEYVLEDSGSKVFITHKNKVRVVNEAIKRNKKLEHIVWCGLEEERSNSPQFTSVVKSHLWTNIFNRDDSEKDSVYPRTIDVDLSNIIYTSGSTGEPKGVMSAHYNVVAATKSISSYLRMSDKDIIINVLPLSFDYGLYQIFLTFFVQGTLILEKSFSYPYKILERITKEKATGFPLVPTMAALILKMKNLHDFDFSSLRFISNTAAALPITFIKEFQKVFNNTQIFSMYGLTECKRVSYLPPEDLNRKPGSVGIPMQNEEVFILDDNGNVLKPNEIGELVIRGSNVMQGYWNDPQTTSKVFREGKYGADRLLYSSDLFKQDEDGYLYFVGRKDDMIKTKGERVSPKEIESMIYEMDGISEVAVFGVPDNILGQVVAAFIVSDEHVFISDNQVKKYCSQNLEPFMVPKFVEFIDEFPKSPSGKIDKKLISKNFINKMGE